MSKKSPFIHLKITQTQSEGVKNYSEIIITIMYGTAAPGNFPHDPTFSFDLTSLLHYVYNYAIASHPLSMQSTDPRGFEVVTVSHIVKAGAEVFVSKCKSL